MTDTSWGMIDRGGGVRLGVDVGGSSVKAALLVDGAVAATAGSAGYAAADGATLRKAIAEAIAALGALPAGPLHTGVCVPGILSPDGLAVRLSVNVPGLVGLDVGEAVRRAAPRAVTGRLMSDALAAAYGHWCQTMRPGRLLALTLGTGVGATVLDDGRPLVVTRGGCGHFGQVDVGPCGEGATPVGPDGGRGSLEAYVGGPALRARFGADVAAGLARVPMDDPFFVALCRAVRIGHAVFAPEEVVLLGGVGLALAGRAAELRARIAEALTAVAASDWRLSVGGSGFLGAVGAAAWPG